MSRGAKLLMFSAMLFSIAHACVKYLGHIPFYEVIVFRALISLGLAAFFLYRKGIPMFGNISHRKLLIYRGVAGTVAMCCYFYTLQSMPLATAVTLHYLAPIFTIILAIFVLGETPFWKQWVYFSMAFSGVILVKETTLGVSGVGFLVGVIGAIFAGLAYNFVRKLRGLEHELVVVFYFPLVSLPLVLPFAWSAWVWPEGWDWFFIVLIGLCTHMAQIAMTRAYQMERAEKIGVYYYFGILCAVALGYFVFGEAFSLFNGLGVLIILIAILLSSRVKAGR